MDLVEGFGIHEDKMIAFLIQVIVILVLYEGFFELIGGLVTLVDLHTVADAAHFDLSGRGTLARMEILRREDDVELAVEVDDIALTDAAGDDGCHA